MTNSSPAAARRALGSVMAMRDSPTDTTDSTPPVPRVTEGARTAPSHRWLLRPSPPAAVRPNTARNLPSAFPQATPKFQTLTELKAYRRNKNLVHGSYDLDKSGAISHREYFIASKFDFNGDGELQPDELAKAKAAVAGGFGSDDFRDYFEYKQAGKAFNQTRFDRVLQLTCRMGSTTYEDTFNRVLTDFDARHVEPEPYVQPTNTTTQLRGRRAAAMLNTSGRAAGADSRHPELCEMRGAAPEATALMLDEQATAVTAAPNPIAPEHSRHVRDGFVMFPRYATSNAMREERKGKMVPDDSYDIDGDGVVAPRDYYLARKFDQDKKHALTPEERQAALNAVGKGLGSDSMNRYFATGQPALTRSDRVLQKTFAVQPRKFRTFFCSPVMPSARHVPRGKPGTKLNLRGGRKGRSAYLQN